MPHIERTPEQTDVLKNMNLDGPVQMLNMLRYKPETGRDSFAKYAANTGPLLKAVGGKVVYQSEARTVLIGDEEWDDILIVEYPSKDAYLEMITSEKYQSGVHFRREALLDARLVCMQRR